MYQFHDIGAGSGGGAAALRFEARFRPPPLSQPPFLRAPVPAQSQPFFADWRERLAELELVTDLGSNIGSLEWCRGFALCAALCYAAYSFAPSIEPLVVAVPAPLKDAQWEQARALGIAPLAYGADTGRRMAATAAVETLADIPERPSVERLAALNPGDGFARGLKRAGVGDQDSNQVEALVAKAMPLDSIAPDTAADLTLGRRPAPGTSRSLDLLTFRARFDLKLQVRRVDGKLVLDQIAIPVDNTPLRIEGRVGSSLFRTARAAGAPAHAIEAFLRALGTQMDVGTIGANDRFDLIVEQKRAATGEIETGELLYAGLERAGGKKVQLLKWEQDGRSEWFEASGVGKSSGMFQRPVPGAITSGFGSRFHPILGFTRMHKGVDFHAAYGSPIVASSDGRVIRSGWAGGYGREVMIDHQNGYQTVYGHMSRIIVPLGQWVHQGQVIGFVGTTGLSTGPHLHYELHRNGFAINPASVKFIDRPQLSGPQLASFRSKLRSLLSVRVGGGAPSQSALAQSARTHDQG